MTLLNPELWRVMAVDDHPESLTIVKFILAFHHAVCLTLSNGTDCLEQIEGYNPNLLLLDLRMPGKSGWEVVQTLRTIPTYKTLPIIALTANAMRGDEEKVMAAGFDGHLIKPISPQTFIADIQAILSRLSEPKPTVELKPATEPKETAELKPAL